MLFYIDSMDPYRYLRIHRYSTFNPFSTHTFFSCSGFTSHMMSTNSSSIFSKMNLSSGMSDLKHAPEISKITTYIPLYESIMIHMNSASMEMAGEDASYLVTYNLWVRPSAYVLPFSFPLRFYYIIFISRSSPFFCDVLMLLRSSTLINFLS